jgi:hypothetical protein
MKINDLQVYSSGVIYAIIYTQRKTVQIILAPLLLTVAHFVISMPNPFCPLSPLPVHSRKFDYDTGSGIFMPMLLSFCSAGQKPIFRHLF